MERDLLVRARGDRISPKGGRHGGSRSSAPGLRLTRARRRGRRQGRGPPVRRAAGRGHPAHRSSPWGRCGGGGRSPAPRASPTWPPTCCEDAAVREVVADQIVTVMERQDPTAELAVSYRPVMKPVVAFVVDSGPFRGFFHAGVRELHAEISQGLQSTLRVKVPDAAQMVRDTLQTTQPSVGRRGARRGAAGRGRHLREHPDRHAHARGVAGRVAGRAVRPLGPRLLRGRGPPVAGSSSRRRGRRVVPDRARALRLGSAAHAREHRLALG